MHYRLEVVMPPVDDVEAAIASIMAPFDENRENEDGAPTECAFWDWYVIGGRFAGAKQLDAVGSERVKLFWDWLKEEKVTVAGLTMGKQELKPESQIPKVDAKWNEMFPEAAAEHCPLFKHSNNQYGKGLSGTLPADVCVLEQCKNVTAERIIFAAHGIDEETDSWTGPVKAIYMAQADIWNGVNFVKTTWDGTLGSALAEYSKYREGRTDECKQARIPKDDWLVVTVDYHD